MNEKMEARQMIKWTNEILSCNNLQHALKIGRSIFGNPLIVSSVSYAILAMTEEPEVTDPHWLDMKSSQSIPIASLSNTNIMRSYQRSRETGEPTLDTDGSKTPMLRKTLLSGGQLVGYLDSPLYFGMPSHLQVEFFDLLGNLIAVRMQHGTVGTAIPDNILDYFAYDLLEGKITDPDVIEERLRYFKWNLLAKGRVQVVAICWIGAENEGTSACRRLLDSLNVKFPACRIFLYGPEIKMICPVTESLQKEGDFVSSLEEILKNGDFSAGVSRPLREANQLVLGNRQARKAAQLGALVELENRVHIFDNLSIYFALERIEDRDAEQLIHSGILTLQEYDREHDGNLVQSLQVYLTHNQSIGESAAALYIHRNTMNYRISKIHELTHMDLGNPSVVFHLLFSFYVMRYREIRENDLWALLPSL